MRRYLEHLSSDIPAGLVVFLVALPLCVGIALASGAPPFAGIISGVIGGTIVVWLSGSQLSVSGPAAGLTIIVLNGIQRIGSYEGLLTAIIIAGFLQIILGFGRAGIIGHYFPSSVIKGMLASIGLILVLKQIPHFLGIDSDFFGDMKYKQADGYNTFSEIYRAVFSVGLGPFVVGLFSMGLMVLWEKPVIKDRKYFNLVPGAFVAVLVSILLNEFFLATSSSFAITGSHLVQLPIIQTFSELKNQFIFPNFSMLKSFDVWIVGFTIAAIASIETLLSIEAADKLDPAKNITPTSRELKAQGIGNIIAALFGGLPMTSVIVRTSANITAGGKTKVSIFIHGLLLIVTILTVPQLLNKIPLSTLAVILILIGYKLTKPVLYNRQYRLGPEQFIPFITTIVAVLFTDLLIGIAVGMAVGIYYVLKANYQNPYSYHKEENKDTHIIKIGLSEQVSFINKASVTKLLHELPENSVVEINGENTKYIDYDVLEAIYDFRDTAIEKKISLSIKNIPTINLTGSSH
jgi:MFS superfamily sulfate permease-like transporter